VFYDYSCLPQGDRTDDEKKLFTTMLLDMNRLYSGRMFVNTKVICIYFTDHFSERAWPFFEWSIATMAGINDNPGLMHTKTGKLIKAFVDFKNCHSNIKEIKESAQSTKNIIETLQKQFNDMKTKFSDQNKLTVILLDQMFKQLDTSDTQDGILKQIEQIFSSKPAAMDLMSLLTGPRILYHENLIDNQVRDELIDFVKKSIPNFDEAVATEKQRESIVGHILQTERQMLSTLSETGYDSPKIDEIIKMQTGDFKEIMKIMNDHHILYKNIITHSLVLELRFCTATNGSDIEVLQRMMSDELMVII
jgi:hypothetical protein